MQNVTDIGKRKNKKVELRNFKWTKSHLKKLKAAFKKYGFGNSANKRIAEYICDSLRPSDIVDIKSSLKKIFKVNSIKDIIDSKKFQKYIDMHKDDENISFKEQNVVELNDDLSINNSYSTSNDSFSYENVNELKEENPKKEELYIILKRSVILDYLNSLKKEKSCQHNEDSSNNNTFNIPTQSIPLEISRSTGKTFAYTNPMAPQFFRGPEEIQGDYKVQNFDNRGENIAFHKRNPYLTDNDNLKIQSHPSPHNFGEDLPKVSQPYIPKDSNYYHERGISPTYFNEPNPRQYIELGQAPYYGGVSKYHGQSYPPYKVYNNSNMIPKYLPQHMPVYNDRSPIYNHNMYGNQINTYSHPMSKHQDIYIDYNYGDKDGYDRNMNQFNERSYYPPYNTHNLMYTSDTPKNYPPKIYTSENTQSSPPPPSTPRKYMRYAPLNKEQYRTIMDHPYYHVNK